MANAVLSDDVEGSAKSQTVSCMGTGVSPSALWTVTVPL
jgi:hypothetical protein